ncbi:methyltransferase domain-containing protein [Rubripirellula amarantea]|nr:methyltransferase domain-containing protein [Rubripirellula amarantea]
MTSNPAQRFYDRISHAYDMIADGGEHVARERGLELLAAQPGESILEVGFGTGHSLVSLAKAVGDTGKVVGVDISSGMRDVAQKRLEKSGHAHNVELVVQETPPLPFEDAQFDAVVMSFTLELFPIAEIPAVLAECKRVLKNNGRLSVVSMAEVLPDDHASILEHTYVWMHTHFPHIVDCQPIPVEAMITDAGFTITTQERMGLFTMPVAIVIATNQ